MSRGWLVWLVVGCRQETEALEADAVLEVKRVVTEELEALGDAAVAIRSTTPAFDGGGWASDGGLDATRSAWRDTRASYERIEGAIAVLFPDLDASTDERYDGFLADGADPYAFDGEGVIGVHAVERILWADAIPPSVVAFESALTGYAPAAFPETDSEAVDLADLLVQRLIDDFEQMSRDFEPLALDPAAAYEGVVGSMAEQVEKVTLGATGEDESRYAQNTLADMRANLEGGRTIYGAFSVWVRSADGGEALDAAVAAGFDRVSAGYDSLSGDGLPAVPPNWNPDAPSAADLETDYGQLYSLLSSEADPEAPGSLVADMVAAAASIGIEILP